MKIAIVGAGELGKLLAHHARAIKDYSITGYYDDFYKEAHFNGLPVLGKCDDLLPGYQRSEFDAIIIAIGYYRMAARVHYYNFFKGKVPFANIIHPSCYVDESCTLGEGICLMPGCTLDYAAEIEDNVLLNTGVTIAHHSKISKNSFLGPAVKIAGYVNVGEACFLGIGSTIIDCLKIADGSIIGAGAVVIKDTQKNSVSVGVPSKTIKFHSTGDEAGL